MPGNNAQEAFQALSPALDNFVREPVRKDLAGERRNVHPGRLALQDISERFKVGVTPPHDGVAKLKGWDVRLAQDFIVGIHFSPEAVRLRVPHFNLEEAFRDAIHFLDRLLPPS